MGISLNQSFVKLMKPHKKTDNCIGISDTEVSTQRAIGPCFTQQRGDLKRDKID